MADFTYGVLRPNWVSATGVETLTSHMEFITISTGVDIRTAAQNLLVDPTGAAGALSQAALNKLLEIVSERGQPVIMGAVTGTSSPFGLFLATEHLGWSAVQGTGVAAVGGPQLIDRIVTDGVNYGFPADNTAHTLVVTIGSTLT